MSRTAYNQLALAQNFLKSSKLVRSLLSASSITPGDIVYEIGPGRGIITAELAPIARKVIAIEKDSLLAGGLHRRFQDVENVEIIADDFLRYYVHHREYKIFANIPYNLTADILRKILYTPPFPVEAYLVMQKEAAQKFSGSPCETQFSILAKPMFELQIIRELRRTDFQPVPHVDSVLLRIKRRASPLLRKDEISLYRSFVRYGFGRWKRNLKLIFEPVFTYPQWKRLSKDLHFPLDATPSQLSFGQWLGLFECFKERVPMYKQGYVQR
ncbi:MAG TPA: 23S ribosomal RNA methyltransferase Erm [Anaerolineales bacterium]|nr:23S ribosomal RNA methyltransferase Erm [Anaerolineales bacterium]